MQLPPGHTLVAGVHENHHRKGSCHCAKIYHDNGLLSGFAQMNDVDCPNKAMPFLMDTSALTEDRDLQRYTTIPNDRRRVFEAKCGKPRHLETDPRANIYKYINERLLMMPIQYKLLQCDEAFY